MADCDARGGCSCSHDVSHSVGPTAVTPPRPTSAAETNTSTTPPVAAAGTTTNDVRVERDPSLGCVRLRTRATVPAGGDAPGVAALLEHLVAQSKADSVLHRGLVDVTVEEGAIDGQLTQETRQYIVCPPLPEPDTFAVYAAAPSTIVSDHNMPFAVPPDVADMSWRLGLRLLALNMHQLSRSTPYGVETTTRWRRRKPERGAKRAGACGHRSSSQCDS